MDSLPVRGAAVRRLGPRIPAAGMPRVHARRPLTRWRSGGVCGPELTLCVAVARVGGTRRRWWAVALPDGTLVEGTRGVELPPGRARVRGVLDLELDEP